MKTEDLAFTDLSPTQQKVLRILFNYGYSDYQFAGYGGAPKISAARALMRKGLVDRGYHTGHYSISKEGVALMERNGFKSAAIDAARGGRE